MVIHRFIVEDIRREQNPINNKIVIRSINTLMVAKWLVRW